MAKNSILTLLILWLATGFCAGCNCGDVTLRDSLESVYSSQIGVREKTGRNDGDDVEKYLASCNLGKGYAWCAAFVNWCLEQVGVKTIKNAWVASWFPSGKVIYRREGKNNIIPQKGDLFAIWDQVKKLYVHIGFIHRWSDDWIITVEGNTNDAGSSEGDGVYRKRRLKRQIAIAADWIN